jgi:shikimate dehydrogenase
MKLGLIGKNISHSGSPAIYKKLFGSNVKYDLIDIQEVQNLPSLLDLAKSYDGLNITSPYKTHYFSQVIIQDSAVQSLGAINTLAFTPTGIQATNTDLLAVRSILSDYKSKYASLNLIILGSGVMARLTMIVAEELKLPMTQLSRSSYPDLTQLDLCQFEEKQSQNLVINACSRDFIFKGKQSLENIFWDYNYHFLPHQNTLPLFVKEYQDGQEMLYLQAVAAKQCWLHNKH